MTAYIQPGPGQYPVQKQCMYTYEYLSIKVFVKTQKIVLSTLQASIRHLLRSIMSFNCEKTLSEGALEAEMAKYLRAMHQSNVWE